jgi:DNA-binding CsgD family transcriptional regulator
MGRLLFPINHSAPADYTQVHVPLEVDAPDSEMPVTADELMDQFERPMFIVNESRQLTHHNALGAQALQAGELFYLQGGCLVCRHKQDDESLRQAIISLRTQHFNGDASPLRRVLTLRKADGLWCLAFVSAMVPRQDARTYPCDVRMASLRLLIVVSEPQLAMSALDPLVVARCLRLTPSEARVAMQMAKGANAKKIARDSGTALSTVRTHIRQVMDKAGVRRQAELIGVMAGLALRL